MKFLLLNITIFLIIYVAYSAAQPPCVGRPSSPTCAAPRNQGQPGIGCESRNVWYYDARSRQCYQMEYLGCGGNNNRWCTRAACEQRCVRSQ